MIKNKRLIPVYSFLFKYEVDVMMMEVVDEKCMESIKIVLHKAISKPKTAHQSPEHTVMCV